MDDFTNYIVSGVLTVGVWGIGAVLIHFSSNDSVAYLNWLKIWALTAAIQAIVFSLAIGALFPSPATMAVENSLDSAITNPGSQELPEDIQKELDEATK
jgi:hypothetical protein